MKPRKAYRPGAHRHRWLAAIAFILFVLLTISVMAGLTVRFEGWAYSESIEHMSPALTLFQIGITNLGDPVAVILFCLLLLALPGTRKTIARPVAVTVIISFLLNLALKNLFDRERPDILRLINETSYSFPSGHAMINASLYSMLILLIYEYVGKPWRLVLAVLCAALAIAIGLSRIYLGVHYAGDVIGGWLIGLALSLTFYSLRTHTLND